MANAVGIKSQSGNFKVYYYGGALDNLYLTADPYFSVYGESGGTPDQYRLDLRDILVDFGEDGTKSVSYPVEYITGPCSNYNTNYGGATIKASGDGSGNTFIKNENVTPKIYGWSNADSFDITRNHINLKSIFNYDPSGTDLVQTATVTFTLVTGAGSKVDPNNYAGGGLGYSDPTDPVHITFVQAAKAIAITETDDFHTTNSSQVSTWNSFTPSNAVAYTGTAEVIFDGSNARGGIATNGYKWSVLKETTTNKFEAAIENTDFWITSGSLNDKAPITLRFRGTAASSDPPLRYKVILTVLGATTYSGTNTRGITQTMNTDYAEYGISVGYVAAPPKKDKLVTTTVYPIITPQFVLSPSNHISPDSTDAKIIAFESCSFKVYPKLDKTKALVTETQYWLKDNGDGTWSNDPSLTTTKTILNSTNSDQDWINRIGTDLVLKILDKAGVNIKTDSTIGTPVYSSGAVDSGSGWYDAIVPLTGLAIGNYNIGYEIAKAPQKNYKTITLVSRPIATPEQLVFNPVTGSKMFAKMQPDWVLPSTSATEPTSWYHGGPGLYDTSDIKLFDSNIEHLTLSNNVIDVPSDWQEKGVYEISYGGVYTINKIYTSTGTKEGNVYIETNLNNELVNKDKIIITGLSAYIPDGIYKIIAINSSLTTTTILINLVSDTSIAPNSASGQSQKVVYYWDEVYTTPLGKYFLFNTPIGNINTAGDFPVTPNLGDTYLIKANVTWSKPPTPDQSFTIGQIIMWNGTNWTYRSDYYYYFEVDKNIIHVKITDYNIIPKKTDTLSLQIVYDENVDYSPSSTTDDLNSLPNTFGAEQYLFQITDDPVTDSEGLWRIVLDKSINLTSPLNLDPFFMLVLLNRGENAGEKNLYGNTWELHEVHRNQLLGDPYNNTDSSKMLGRKNYLYYDGSDYLGYANQFSERFDTNETPFIVLHFNDEVKDRINPSNTQVEIHLPNIMIQGENTPTILTNKNVIQDTINGAGSYSKLYMKYSKTTNSFGYIFHDWRVVIITDAELAIALGYNSNRNYTLPTPKIKPESVENSTILTPTPIDNVNAGNTILITTKKNHNFQSGDMITVYGVEGTVEANTAAGQFMYVKVQSNLTFEIYYDALLNNAVKSTNNYTKGGYCYGNKLPYEYFFTYRFKTPHYETLSYAELTPFNFVDQTTKALIDNSNGMFTFNFDQLTHLMSQYTKNAILYDRKEGIKADMFEVIIGKYVQSTTDSTQISTIENVKIFPGDELVDDSNTEKDLHTFSITYQEYNTFTNVLDIASLRAYPTHSRKNLLQVLSNNFVYCYDDRSSATDDGVNVIKPDGVTGVGRWLKSYYGVYNILNNQPIYSVILPNTLFTGKNTWLVGNIRYVQNIRQHRLTLKVIVPAANWNGTTNPTFDPLNDLMKEKLISEIGFFIDDYSLAPTNPESVVETPFIYAKINPPVKKSVTSDITITIRVDF